MILFSVSRLLVIVAAVVTLAHAHVTEVDTEYGRIKGDWEPLAKITGYYGIPFAAPPTGAMRFKPPVPPTPWSKTKDCTVDKLFHICPQFHEGKKAFIGSEDCLYMNVYVPEEAEKEPLPILFWIYGGGFSVGDGYEFGWYRGKNLASKERVIVVEFNYRLGALGFLGLDEFRAANVYNSTGNFGTQDQTAALEFIYRNAKAFGGDNRNITIFGESAGAMSVCWHVVSPKSRGLFHSAIMESGTCSSPEFFVSQPRAQMFGNEVVKKTGCDSAKDVLTCLQALDVYELFMSASDWPIANGTAPPLAPVMPWGPVIDGTIYGLPDRPIEMINRGNCAQVPMYIGTNHDEGTIFVPALAKVIPGVTFPVKDDQVNLILNHVFNASASNIITSMYPATNFKSTDERVAIVLRDYFFLCATRRALLALDKLGVPVYTYQFNMPLHNWIDYDVLGNYHTSELSFVFDNEWPPIVHEFDEKERRMSDVFTSYWSNLARFNNPNENLNKDQVQWPRFTAADESYINMDIPVTTGQRLNHDLCVQWDKLYAKYYFD